MIEPALMHVENPTLEVDLAAICANYRRLAASAPGAAAAAVVKCDAYGLGVGPVARALLAETNCRTFFVAYSEEGAELRALVGAGPEIYVFNGPFENTLKLYSRYALTPVLNSPEQAALWAKSFPGASAAIHIDTGINRLGFRRDDAAGAMLLKGLNVATVMSHLACASDRAHPMNEEQRREFRNAARMFPTAKTSLSASGGVLISPEFACDIVRLGVGLYGVDPHDDGDADLQPVASLNAPILQLHPLAAGEAVGYGASFRATGDRMLATVALGYGDGYPRNGSNSGAAIVNGVSCPIVGRVSMDLIVLDVTDCGAPPDIGDRAEFFGKSLPIEIASEACGTIAYELLTNIGGLARERRGLGGRVRRRYLFDGAPAPDSLVGAETIAEGK